MHGVCGVDRLVRSDATIRIVRAGEVYATRERIHGGPFGPIHARRSDVICGATRIDQNIRLATAATVVIGVIAPAFDLHDAYAVRGDLLADLVLDGSEVVGLMRAPGRIGVGMDELGVDVFVVQAQQAVMVGVLAMKEREVRNAVVVSARLQFPVSAAVEVAGYVGRGMTRQRLPFRKEHLHAVTGGHEHLVERRMRHGFKAGTERRSRLSVLIVIGVVIVRERRLRQCRAQCNGYTASDELSPVVALLDDVGEPRIR